jgi:hypothetical protein
MISYDILVRGGNMTLPDILYVSIHDLLLWMSMVGLAGALGTHLITCTIIGISMIS